MCVAVWPRHQTARCTVAMIVEQAQLALGPSVCTALARARVCASATQADWNRLVKRCWHVA